MKKDTRCNTCINGDQFGEAFCSICAGGDMYKQKRSNISYTEYHHKYNPKSTLPIQNVVFNPPATIVMWSDGTKTVVKCENEVYDPEKGLAMAIAKRALGNKGNYYNEFKKWIKVDKNDTSSEDPETTDEKKKDSVWKIWCRLPHVTRPGVVLVSKKSYARMANAERAASRYFTNASDNGDVFVYWISKDNPFPDLFTTVEEVNLK